MVAPSGSRSRSSPRGIKQLLITDGDPKPPRSCLKELNLASSGDDELATCFVTGEAVSPTSEGKKRITRVGSIAVLMLAQRVSYRPIRYPF
ncbi:hypothetical protein PspLS_11319 [Pyricularia sp. CBS 133598]|nr:hypothetical protein PspLS_11319 [Pyricularia sp. CBS 133598]